MEQIEIEFLYWEDCPSHERAFALLHEVLAEEGIEAPVAMTKVDTEEDVTRHGFPGSPTIRINGRDIEGDLAPPPALTCRMYVTDEGRISPLPPKNRIISAVRAAAADKERV